MKDETTKRDMEIIDVPGFSFDGYQVVRGEFFAHIYEPSITFSNYKVGVNTACIKKLPGFDFVQILVNPEQKKLAVRPCREDEKDSFRWCSATSKRAPKKITCRMFFAKVFSLMDWNLDYRYKLLGKLIRSGDELLFLFDLNNAEKFSRTVKEEGKTKTYREAIYPESWQNQFGTPVEEHRKAMQISFFDDYAIFGLQQGGKTTKKPSAPEPERKDNDYEQISYSISSRSTSLATN